jgi:hypothetical protein
MSSVPATLVGLHVGVFPAETTNEGRDGMLIGSLCSVNAYFAREIQQGDASLVLHLLEPISNRPETDLTS